MRLSPRNVQLDLRRSRWDINVLRATPSLTGTPSWKYIFGCDRSQCLQGDIVNRQCDFPRFIHIPRPDDASHQLQVVVAAKQWSLGPTLEEILNFVSGLPGFLTHFPLKRICYNLPFAFSSAASHQSRMHRIENMTIIACSI